MLNFCLTFVLSSISRSLGRKIENGPKIIKLELINGTTFSPRKNDKTYYDLHHTKHDL